MAQSLHHQHCYLLSKEFILYYDHQALMCLGSSHKLSERHVASVEFLPNYTSVLKHHFGMENKVIDALSRVTTMLHFMSTNIVGFE